MQVDFDAIRRDYPLLDIVSQYVALVKDGREYKACCPFHNEKTPSFAVVPEKGFYHCFGCGAHGDVVDFVQEYNNAGPMDAIDIITGGKPKEAPSPERIAAMEAARIEQNERIAREHAIAAAAANERWEAAKPAPDSNAYLVKKGVLPNTCRVEGANLLVPIYDSTGGIMSVQAIQPDSGKVFHKGAPVRGGRYNIGIYLGRVIIAEGYATGASIAMAVSDRVCVAFSKGNIHNVARDLVARGCFVVIASDTNAVAEMRKLADDIGCAVAIPDCGSDFNDQHLERGLESIATAIDSAVAEYVAAIEGKKQAAERDNESAPNGGPVDLWRVPPPPALNRGVLPKIIEDFAFERSEQLGTDPSGLAMAALATCAGVIKDEIKIKPKRHEDWTESARLWVMLVGVPSAKKSPIISAATARVKAIDNDMLVGNNQALADWQEDGGNKSGEPKPLSPRLRMGDTTMEAAQEVCRESPDGVLSIQDELSGWFGAIEKYSGGKGSGADRAFWLQAYGGGSYAVNRVGRGSFLIKNLSVSIIGGIQPSAIRNIMIGATDDGLIQRFLPVILGPAGLDKDIEIAPVAAEFGYLIDGLRALSAPDTITGHAPLIFDDEGQKIREQVRDRNDTLVKSLEGVNAKLSSHIGKFDGIFPRLCLAWHCIEHVARSRAEGRAVGSPPRIIPGVITRRVAAFVKDFVMRHSMSFYTGTLGLSDNQDTVRAVAGYILQHKLDDVTMRTLERGVHRLRGIKAKDERERVIDHLVAFGWLTPVQRRSDAPSWTVTPEVHTMYAGQAEDERQNRARILDAVRDLEG